MQCEVCQSKEATIHLTEIADGVRTEMHLCEQCAQEQGVGTKGTTNFICSLVGAILGYFFIH